MRKFVCFFLVLFSVPTWAAPINLTGDSAHVEDITVDKPNYYVTIFSHTSSASYEVNLDIWPEKASVVGSFSAKDETIDWYNSGLTKSNGYKYFCEENSQVAFTIRQINADTCAISGTIQAARKGVMYTYNIAEFRFAYKAGDIPDDPTKDPYRFEPEGSTTMTFNGQIVEVRDYREKTGWINLTLVDSVNQKLDWIELDWVSDTFAMPEGTITFTADSTQGTFIASPGYIGKTDYPSYIALRGAEWGDNTTVYYIKSGCLTFSLNNTGDTVYIQGEVTTQHGSTCTIYTAAYNMFYFAPLPPKQQEEKELAMDSVVITYTAEKNGMYDYEFNFSYQEDFPNLVFNAILPTPNSLAEGTYTLTDGEVSAILLFQNQDDFNEFFHYGDNYVFVTFSMTLTDLGNGVWRYTLDMTDEVGSHYWFTLEQAPHLISSTALPKVKGQRSAIKVLRRNRIEIERNGIRYHLSGSRII